MIHRRPLPCAVRPFAAEALGSWIGRLAGRYQMTVEELDLAFCIGLANDARLQWLAPGPISDSALETLTHVARIDGAALLALDTPRDWADATHARYCPRCVFVNPADVAHPFWQRRWLEPRAGWCAVHSERLSTITALEVRTAGNIPRLLRAVGALEQQRRSARIGRY